MQNKSTATYLTQTIAEWEMQSNPHQFHGVAAVNKLAAETLCDVRL